MNVLLDTDILIDVALDRMPFAAESSAVLDMAQQRSFHAFIAWHSLSNFYYIVDSESHNLDSRDFIRDLLKFVEVAPTTTKEAIYAVSLNMKDFEDALQVSAAKVCGADFIVTWNVKHYKGGHVLVRTPKEFLRRLRVQ